MANLGHEIALSEMRISARSFAIRIMWAFGISFCFLLFCIFVFGKQGVVIHVIQFLKATANFEIRKIPILGVRRIDIQNVLHTHDVLMRDATFWKISLISSVLVFFIAFVWLSVVFFKKGQRSQLEHIMRGNRLITAQEHNKVMKWEYNNVSRGIKFKRFKTTEKVKVETPLVLGKERALIPESLQYLHFAFIGASGCGKSTAIEEIISQIQNRKEKAFIVDLNGAFYSKFGRKGDYILSLRDPRSKAWDFWCEDVEAENIAAAMIEAEHGHQYFWKGGRAVLASLLRNNTNCHELWEDFKKSTADIRNKLSDKNEISQRIIGNVDGDQADGILGTTVLDFAFLKELNQWSQGQKRFSITDWVKNDQDLSWVYLIVSDKDLEISKPLLRVWFDLACIGALNREALNPSNAHLWLMIDELKSIGQLPSLPAILDKGRKYKSSVVLGLQAISQIEKIYGTQDSKSILQGVQNQFYFKMSEVQSARYASDVLGEQEFEQASLGISFGQKNNQDRGSLNRSTMHKKIVLPDEIKSLKPLECYAKLCHHQPFKMQFNVANRQQIHAPVQSKINKNYKIGKNVSRETFAPEEHVPKIGDIESEIPMKSESSWLLGVPQKEVQQ